MPARRLLPGWAECFQIIPVRPLSHQQTRDIAETMLKDAGRNYRVDVEDTAAETATRLFAQFMPYVSPPKGVVQLIGDVIEETIRRESFLTSRPDKRAKVPQRCRDQHQRTESIRALFRPRFVRRPLSSTSPS